jgi:nicotinamidase/pyrazinamidase
MNKINLVIIDPQNDFSDEKGSLFVSGANNDMGVRLPQMIAVCGDRIDKVFVTLDTHPKNHIAHGCFWVNANGEHPAPFTSVTKEDVESGKWKPVDESLNAKAENFAKTIGSFMIWPEHCVDGTEGHDVVPALQTALAKWESRTGKKVTYIRKGMNPITEQFSVFEASVPDPDDDATHLNSLLISAISEGDAEIMFAGEASSHCVANSVTDFVKNVKPEVVSRVTLVVDAMSAVAGCEGMAAEFFKDMDEKNVRCTSTATECAKSSAAQKA